MCVMAAVNCHGCVDLLTTLPQSHPVHYTNWSSLSLSLTLSLSLSLTLTLPSSFLPRSLFLSLCVSLSLQEKPWNRAYVTAVVLFALGRS